MIGLGLGLTTLRNSASVSAYAVAGFDPNLFAAFADGKYRANSTSTNFDGVITHARASTATYVDATGTLQTAAVDEPRVGHHIYDGSQWVNEGILHESEARTNVLLDSGDPTTANWQDQNTGTLALDATGPDGASNSALTLADSAAGGTGIVRVYQTPTVSNSTTYTLSVFAKKDQLSWLLLQANAFTTPGNTNCWFDLSTGTLGAVSGDSSVKTSIQNFGNGWYRCAATFTTDATDTSGQTLIASAEADGNTSVDLDGTSSILVFGAQFEEGPTPSSYIPTAGSQVTRAADSMTIPAAKLPYDATNMSIAMEGTITWAASGTTSNTQFLFTWEVDSQNRIFSFLDTRSAKKEWQFRQVRSSITDAVTTASGFATPGINVPFSIASRHGSTFINGAVDGTALTANTTPTALPDLSATDLDLGDDFMGTIRLFRMWNEDLDDTGIEEASA